MAFRYMNPGFAELLDSGTTSTTVADAKYTRTGTAFTQTTRGGFTLTEFPNNEIWIRADVYLEHTNPTATSYTMYLYAPGNFDNGFYLRRDSNRSVYLYFKMSGNNKSIGYSGDAGTLKSNYGLVMDSINSFLVHIKYGSSGTGFVEVTINDKTLSNTGTSVATGSQEMNCKMYATTVDAVFSNIIVSDSEISVKEQIIALPVSVTETDMESRDGGLYVADSIGQTLLQKINTQSLSDDYGADSKVTGIMLVGNPAYRTGEVVNSLTGISKADGTITEHGTHTLPTDTAGIIADSYAVADTTIADLSDVQLGWKSAGE